MKRYCAAKPAAEMSNDTVHQLYRLLSQAKILDLEQEATSSTHSTPSSSTPEWTTVPESNWQQLVATEKAKGGECFKQKDFQAVACLCGKFCSVDFSKRIPMETESTQCYPTKSK